MTNVMYFIINIIIIIIGSILPIQHRTNFLLFTILTYLMSRDIKNNDLY